MASYITTYKHPPTHIFLPKTHTHSFTRAQPSIYKKCLQIKTHTPIYTYMNHFVGAVTVVRLKFCQKYVVVVSGKVELIFYQNLSLVIVVVCDWPYVKTFSLLSLVVYDYYEWPVWLVFYQNYFITKLLREWLSFKLIFLLVVIFQRTSVKCFRWWLCISELPPKYFGSSVVCN